MSKRIISNGGVVHRRLFNNNRSSIVWAWSYINQAWMVWRQDGAYQGNVRVHNDWDLAQEDYQNRVQFINQMGV